MAPLKVGDKFPEGITFDWAPITDPDPTSCGLPQPYKASEEFKDKKTVLVSVPGAFTPGCQAYHIPPYIQKLPELNAKGVDQVVVIGFNDPFVMSAWGKVNGMKSDSKIYFVSDGDGKKFSAEHGWMAGVGERLGRYAMVIEKDGTISYAASEKSPREVTVSGAEEVLSKL